MSEPIDEVIELVGGTAVVNGELDPSLLKEGLAVYGYKIVPDESEAK